MTVTNYRDNTNRIPIEESHDINLNYKKIKAYFVLLSLLVINKTFWEENKNILK